MTTATRIDEFRRRRRSTVGQLKKEFQDIIRAQIEDQVLSPSLLSLLLFPPFISPSPSPSPVTLTSFNLHSQVRTETHQESPETMSQMVAQREKDTGQKIRKDMFVREKKLIDYEPKYGPFPFSLLRSPLSHLYSLIQLATNYSQAI